MSTIDDLTAAVKRAGIKVGGPTLEAIDATGCADIDAWLKEFARRGIPWQREVLERIQRIALGMYPKEAAPSGVDGASQHAKHAMSSADEAAVTSTAGSGADGVTSNTVSSSAPSSGIWTIPAEPTPAAPAGVEASASSGPSPDSVGTNSLSVFSSEYAPHTPQAEIRREGDVLAWEPYLVPDSQPGTVLYLVVGGNEELDHPAVGFRLGSTSETRLQLRVVPRYVSIFAYVGRTAQEATAAAGLWVAKGEFVPPVDINETTDVQVQARSATLQWVSPVGASEHRVFRSQPDASLKLPPGPQDEIRAVVAQGQGRNQRVFSFTDSDLTPGAAYEYWVVAVVHSPDGSTHESDGRLVRITTTDQLEPVTQLFIRPLNGEYPAVELAWGVPESGRVAIVQSIRDPSSEDLVPGLRTLAQLTPLGEELKRQPDTHRTDDRGRQYAGFSNHELPVPDFEDTDGRPTDSPVTLCFTAVTIGANGFMVGATKAVPLIEAVKALSIVDRVDWQLLRLRWPRGATQVQVVVRMESGTTNTLVDRDTFDQVGGIMLSDLGGARASIAVRGVCPHENQQYFGAGATVTYDGHRLLRYGVATTWHLQGLKKMYDHQVTVQLEGDWPVGQQLGLVGGTNCPLTFDNTLVPDLVPIASVTIPAHGLQPGVVTMAPLQPSVGFYDSRPNIRLVTLGAQDASTRPMLTCVPKEEASGRRQQSAATPLRCPECFAWFPSDIRVFVCTADCKPTADNDRARVLGLKSPEIRRLTAKHAQPAANGKGFLPLPSEVACEGCGRTTRQMVCPSCHALLPPGWPDTDLMTVSIIGSKGSGKSVFVLSLLPYLRDAMMRRLGGSLRPAATSASAEQKLAEVKRMKASWTLPEGTATWGDDSSLRLPILLNLGSFLGAGAGRMRALSIFDTAGEMLENATLAVGASAVLANSDLVILMADARQLSIVTSSIASQDRVSEVDPSAVLTNLTMAIRSASGHFPRLAVVLNQFDLVQEAARGQGRLSAVLNLGNAVFQDPYALEHNWGKLYLPGDAALVDAECRQLLRVAGWQGFVDEVAQYPGESQFFAISAIGGDPNEHKAPEDGISPFRVADPLRWVMDALWGTRSGR